MGGWNISISTLTQEEKDRADIPTIRAGQLAHWDVYRHGGLDWIDDLVASGKAVQLAKGGYPNRYTANAADVLPHIEDEHIKASEFDRSHRWKVHKERIAACRDDQLLTLYVWDLS